MGSITSPRKGNHPKFSRGNVFRNFLFPRAHLMVIYQVEKVVCGEIFCSFYITDNDIKFLEQQNPPEQSWLSILLSKQERIFKSRTKKKAKTKQNQARNGRDKVKGTKEIEGWDLLEKHLTQQAHLVFALTKEAQAASPRDEDFGYK
ncbi:hypothetical protein Tco_0514534 [Tanacetum coccineum]